MSTKISTHCYRHSVILNVKFDSKHRKKKQFLIIPFDKLQKILSLLKWVSKYVFFCFSMEPNKYNTISNTKPS